MTTAKLIINGREIEVQLTDEEVAKFIPKQKTGFERVDYGNDYMYISEFGRIISTQEDFCAKDNAIYESGNYYTDESLAEWCARQETLLRKMRRWAAEHNNPNDKPTFRLYLDNQGDLHCSAFIFETRDIANCVYFTGDVTGEAISEFGEEYKWLCENRPKTF